MCVVLCGVLKLKSITFTKIDTSLMIVTVKKYEKDLQRIANCTAEHNTFQEKFPCILLQKSFRLISIQEEN